ncbi:MAG: hypothetical protein GKR94_04585 [Gammaproteobacteria bacterium]|nr:hypothetical protein [Gammaproteobacteria bacterium]
MGTTPAAIAIVPESIVEACNEGTVAVAHIIGTAIGTRALVVGHGRIETPLLCHRRGPALSGGGQFNKTCMSGMTQN